MRNWYGKMLDMKWDMLYFMHLYDRLLIFFLFDFIIELINIFMVMISISKIELINATENYLLISFLLESFLSTELVLVYPILIWSISRVIDIVWTNMLYNILSSECELKIVYQQSFPVDRKLPILFWPKCFDQVLFLIYGKSRIYI